MGGGGNSTFPYFKLSIYLRTNKTLTHNSLYVFDKWRETSSHKKIQYSYSKKRFTGRAKEIRIIGDSDNQRPDKWNSTVFNF